MSANVETAFYFKEPAWHGLGTILDNPPTSWDALVQSGLNWEVFPEKVYLENGTEIPNIIANVRQSDHSILGTVTEKYKIVQNREAFAFLDELLKNDSPVTFESAGSLDHGKKIWILAHLPPKKILDDEIVPYLVFANSFDGKQALTVAMTPTRVVCQNTLNIALKNAKRSWSIRHMGNVEYKQQNAQETLKLSYEYMDNLEVYSENLQQKKITKNKLDDIMTIVFPIDKNNSTRMNTNILDTRKEIENIYKNIDDIKKFNGSAWGVYNAFADYVSHARPKRLSGTYREKLFNSFIDGNSMLKKAQEAIELVA
ncbi:MAG: DUF932 domain-containing protein [Candidatus Nanoarchaeia archaeon]|nr:DUF932 domain-containing protein [Candidatus Nanoarchaeia archaeon]